MRAAGNAAPPAGGIFLDKPSPIGYTIKVNKRTAMTKSSIHIPVLREKAVGASLGAGRGEVALEQNG